jgi:arginine decarboxylase
MPIKVNQQRHVVQELIGYGRKAGLGLEAGSKPELLVAITLSTPGEGLIVCNGYKDIEYIETALLATNLGIKTLIIVDRFEELGLIIAASRRLKVAPYIGVRAKLASKGAGKWAESGGDRSKFGLTSSQVVQVVETLRAANMLDRLKCLHFHIGSQITAIRAIKDALREGSRIYASLHKMGAPLGFFDVGGGLAIDYDGSKSNFHASKNYSMEEYAADVVDSIGSTLDEAEVPHPTILSESGRALVAHHAVLVFNVLGRDSLTAGGREMPPPREDDPAIIDNMREVCQSVTRKNYQEVFHDAVQLRDDGLSMFRHGLLTLEQRAQLEELFWATTERIWRIVGELDYVPDELSGLQRQMADTYFCNFSVFQSVPDAWAVNHLFPVMPIHRLAEKPSRLGILADLTCDSDGKIDQFIDLHDVERALELHDPGVEPYYLGVFLVGAYQEVLGDLHNLFGDVNAVHIESDGGHGYRVTNIIGGDTVKEVLGYVEYEIGTMWAQLRNSIEMALQAGRMTFEESAALVRHFEAGLSGYTYLEERE